MKYLSVADVIFIHDDMIAKYGGSPGIRDMGLLESAVHRSRASFGGQDLYPTVFEKTAALFHSILLNHPFFDGNKRTAITSAAFFLENNGYTFKASVEGVIAFPLFVEETRTGILEIAHWFKGNAHKRKRRKRV